MNGYKSLVDYGSVCARRLSLEAETRGALRLNQLVWRSTAASMARLLGTGSGSALVSREPYTPSNHIPLSVG